MLIEKLTESILCKYVLLEGEGMASSKARRSLRLGLVVSLAHRARPIIESSGADVQGPVQFSGGARTTL